MQRRNKQKTNERIVLVLVIKINSAVLRVFLYIPLNVYHKRLFIGFYRTTLEKKKIRRQRRKKVAARPTATQTIQLRSVKQIKCCTRASPSETIMFRCVKGVNGCAFHNYVFNFIQNERHTKKKLRTVQHGKRTHTRAPTKCDLVCNVFGCNYFFLVALLRIVHCSTFIHIRLGASTVNSFQLK